MKNEKRPLVVLTGPTAVGKTELSIKLAQAVGGEIVSADSMQIYRHMDIGSAKIRPQEMEGVPHHLIDLLEPDAPFHVMAFQRLAGKAMDGIWQRGHIPILTGGTGFYIQSVVKDVAFTPEPSDPLYREALVRKAGEEEGEKNLHEMLAQADPEAAAAIPPQNVKRVVRALEYYHLTGEKISVHNRREAAKASPYRYAYFVLNMERQRLYRRIDERVDRMMEQGLLEEVKALKAMGCTRDMVSMQGLGYKELLAYLEGECTLEEAVYRIKRDTRHFAKRQLTWFRRERDVIWLEMERFAFDRQAILGYIIQVLEEKGILPSGGTKGEGPDLQAPAKGI